MNKLLKKAALIVALGTVFLGRQAQAIPIPPGGAGVPTPDLPPPSALLASTLGTFSVSSKLSGTLTSKVYAPDLGYNAFGGLIFTYDITLDDHGSTGEALGRMTTIDWAGFIADARQSLPGAPALGADRSIDADVIGFDFASGGIPSTFLGPGSSATLILASDALAFKPSSAFFIDGGIASTGTFAPATVSVPEAASTLILLGIGLIGIRACRTMVTA